MIFNMVGGGGGSGATLVVSSPANVSVTVSKDDKSYTKNSGSLGSATFKGLATGTWTVTISGNGQTATKTIGITADYAITIAFFAATINVTYPSGSTCAITTDLTNYSDIIFAGDKSGYWSFTVPYTGTWYVTCFTGDITNPDQIAHKAVSITTDGQIESVALSYATYYYNKGDKCTSVTGGWSKNGSGGSLTFNTASMTLVANNWHSPIDASTMNKVSLVNIKTLYFSVKSATSYSTQGYPRIGVATTSNPDSSEPSQWVASKTLSASSAFATVSIDVRSLTGSYYIVFGGYQGDAGPATIEIQAIWGDDK